MGDAHLRPVRRRGTAPAQQTARRPIAGSGPLSIADAVEAMIRSAGWSRKTAANCRGFFLGSRFTDYLAAARVRHVDELTADHAEEFISLYREQGADPATLAKARYYLRSLARWCATHGHEQALVGIERIRAPRVAIKFPEALTVDQERAVLAACETPRDRLLVETLLATGLRVSELVALRIDDIYLHERPPYAVVARSAHNPKRTKSGDDRVVPLPGLARKLERYIASDRPQSPYRELFLSSRADRSGVHAPLTIYGVEQIMARIGERVGVRCNPHKLRHTFATRAVNAGLPIFHLQQALGHKSVEMVRRYYTANATEMLKSFERLARGR